MTNEKYLPKRCEECNKIILINIKDTGWYQVHICEECIDKGLEAILKEEE